MENITTEEFKCERIINILRGGNKFQKKQVFKEFKVFIEESSIENLRSVFGKLLNPLSLSFHDEIEICRENALSVCIEALNRLEPDISYLSALVPVIHFRLCSEKVYESSEELRLLYIDLTFLLIDKHEEIVSPFMQELVEISCKCILDDAPQVKKKGCRCIIRLAEVASCEFQPVSKKVLAPLSEAIKHQHWRVRVAVIEAYEVAILKGDPKILPDALPPLTNRFFDDTPQVRMALTKLIGNWMLNHYDRYSYHSQMLPLILTSLTDNDEKVRTEGHMLWDKVGNQYALENEKDLKDRMDWDTELPDNYPKGVTRPCLGCRILVQREVGKFALAIGKELSDWVVSVRIKAAQLLSEVVLHAEDSITQDLHKIIIPMTKAAMDEEAPAVKHYVMLAAEYIGHFVRPKTYAVLVFEHIDNISYGDLKIVASMVKGSTRNNLKPFLPKLEPLLKHTTFKGEDQTAQLDFISTIFSTCHEDCFDIGDLIWKALVTVAGLAASESISKKANELLLEFSNLGGGNKRIVYNKYCQSFFLELLSRSWAAHCKEQFILTGIVCYAGEVIETNIDSVIQIAKETLGKDGTDPEVILNVIAALNKIITEEEITLPNLEIREMFKDTLLKEVLYEQLKWKAGRSAEAIRTMAATTMFLLLPRKIPDALYPVIMSLVEDPSVKTRQLALGSVIKCVSLCEMHQPETIAKIVTAVLKRLDDSDQKVREMSVECIKAIYKEEINSSNKEYFNNSLLEFVFSTLLIHLDDKEQKFQNIVLDCLKSISVLNFELLKKKIQIDTFRSKDIAKDLINYIEKQLKDTT